MHLEFKETHVDATRRIGLGEDGWVDFRTTVYGDPQTFGEAFRALTREGISDGRKLRGARCAGKIYRDRAGAEPLACGWVFHLADKYDDTGERFLREVWIEVRARAGDDA